MLSTLVHGLSPLIPLRLQGVDHHLFREHIILLHTLISSRSELSTFNLQIVAFCTYALSSLLIILRVYVFYASLFGHRLQEALMRLSCQRRDLELE